jgi:tripartite-type tricarboxylate transporter receptor subunit TctC
MQPFPAVPWMGIFGPAKMPKEVVDRLSRELAAVLQKPEEIYFEDCLSA